MFCNYLQYIQLPARELKIYRPWLKQPGMALAWLALKWQGEGWFDEKIFRSCSVGWKRLVTPHKIPSFPLHPCFFQALLFDIRKGAHSVGSSVRDAASYVLWALARSQDAAGLKPHALSLAQRLVAVSLYDREIHIRRAASAAFQENVGRLVRAILSSLIAMQHLCRHSESPTW